MKYLILAAAMLFSSAWSNTVNVIVQVPPGGSTDTWARIVAKHLGQELGNDYVVVNRPSADGRIAIESVLQQPADGKNLLIVPTAFMFNKILFKKLNYDYTNFDILIPMTQVPLSLAVSNKLGVSTLKEFVALAQTKQLNCAGSASMAVFVGKYMMTHIKAKDVQFVPFKGSADMNLQLAAGNLDCAFDTTLASVPLHQAGRFKIIATTTEKTMLPDTTTLKTVVPGLVFHGWYGVGVKINTPGTDKLFQALRKINQKPDYQEEVHKVGLEVVEPPEHGSQWMHQEYLKYDAIRERIGIAKE